MSAPISRGLAAKIAFDGGAKSPQWFENSGICSSGTLPGLGTPNRGHGGDDPVQSPDQVRRP
jgi:hypothetical protein